MAHARAVAHPLRRPDAGPRPAVVREGISAPDAWPGLVGRRAECERLGALVAAVVAGSSQVLVVRGEAGIGKTALLRFLVDRATGCRVARAAGVESELEMAFAGLHQLCHPFLDRLPTLPGPQQEALGTAFGLRSGDPPDRFLVGLAVLTLLSEVAEERPLVCVVDDVQWLDQASVQALEFVARRLGAEPVAMVLAARGAGEGPPFAGVPQLVVGPLAGEEAAALLRSAVPGALDRRVRDRVLAECRGNPLALLELHRGASAVELAFGGDGCAGSSLASRLEQGYADQLHVLPRASRQLLLVAAADPVGDARLLWRAVARLGIGEDAVSAAEASGLVELGERVRFRHPLVRSAVRSAATRAELRQVHRVLADVTDPGADPDRRAWHRAQAAVGTDEDVAADLERSAGRALGQGGLAATAAFLERAALLTPDPARRVRRALDAAQAKVVVGAFDDASALLATARTGPLGEAGRARAELLEAQMRSATSRGEEALPLLLAAARRLEPLDADLARDTYLDALSSAVSAGRVAGPDVREVARVVREAPPPRAPRSRDLLLEALAVLVTDGFAAAAPVSRRAVQAFLREDPALDEALRLTPLAASTAVSLWDDAGWDALTRRHVAVARESGAVGALPLALCHRLLVPLLAGDLTAADALVQQVRSVEELTGGRTSLASSGEAAVAAYRGRGGRNERVLSEAVHTVDALDAAVAGGGVDAVEVPGGPRGRGEATGATTVRWARAVLCNGLGRYAEAVPAARAATAGPGGHGPSSWALAELVEAGARSGDTAAAAAVLETLSAGAHASGTEWVLGVAASRRALLRGGRTAEELHREAVDRLTGTRVQVELARARLLYGEWLRREGRRVDARAQLRAAHEAFAAMGAEAFAERARRELQATGETVRRRAVETSAELTAQEAQVARLAARGHTNSEIAAALYISPRTVEWHLRKVFGKLGISTRRELWRSPLGADRVPT